MRAVKCPSCGANLSVKVNALAADCQYCGTHVLIEKKASPAINTGAAKNVINAAATKPASGPSAPEMHYRWYPPAFSASDFKRAVFMRLAENPDVPKEFIQSQFTETEITMEEYIYVEATASASWSVLLGSERQNADGDTVTDWCTHNGKNKISVSGRIYKYKPKLFEQPLYVTGAESVPMPQEEIEKFNIGFVPGGLSQRDLNKGFDSEVRYKIEQKLSGQKRNFNADIDYFDIKEAYYCIPVYKISCGYDGKIYSFYSLCTSLNIFGDEPPSGLPGVEEQAAKMAGARRKRALIASIPIFLSLVIVLILQSFVPAYGMIGVALVIVSTITAVFFWAFYQKARNDIIENYTRANLDEKKEIVQKMF